MHRLFLVALALAIYGGWHWWTTERAVARPPGIVAPDEPVQIDFDDPTRFEVKGYTFIKRARYDITARLLRKEIYHIDGGAGLAPVDLGVAWGPLSDSALIDQLEFTQMGRFFYWRPRNADVSVPTSVLVSHLAQMHMVPATTEIESRLKKLRPGQIVRAGGYLVDVRGPGDFTWNTSLSRTDTGNGACELFWVEDLAAD
jgi:hypothetical protein